jgi:hypothetical protein
LNGQEMTISDPASKAVQGLTSWDSMAHLVTAFGGGNQALIAIGIIAAAVVVIVVCVSVVAYCSVRSNNQTKVAIAQIMSRRKRT